MARQAIDDLKPGVGFGLGRDCAVRILGPWAFQPTSITESALVYLLPPEIERIATALRASHQRKAPTDYQLRPHVTVLFIGILEGCELSDLHERIAPHLLHRCTLVQFAGFGLFEASPEQRSWHIRIEPTAQLSAIRDDLTKLCRESGWHPLPLHYQGGFSPHVTLWDRFEGPVPSPDDALLPRAPFVLSRLLHIGRPIVRRTHG